MKIFYTRVKKELKERKESLKDTLSSGSCQDLQEYGNICGRIASLDIAIDVLDEEFEKITTTSNLDEEFD